MHSSLPSLLKSVFRRRIHTIRHGINISRTLSAAARTEGKINNSFVVATRLIKAKNVDQLLLALSRLGSHWSIDIAGKGPELDKLVKLSKELGIQRCVNFQGFLARDHVLQLMSRSEFYISASSTDGMPIAVLEAVGVGCIPILVDSGPHREISQLGFSTMLYKRNDPHSFEQALMKAHHLDTDEKKRMIDSNIHVLEDKFSCETMMKKYENLAVDNSSRVLDPIDIEQAKNS